MGSSWGSNKFYINTQIFEKNKMTLFEFVTLQDSNYSNSYHSATALVWRWKALSWSLKNMFPTMAHRVSLAALSTLSSNTVVY